MKKRSLGTGNTWSLVFTVCLALFNLGIFGLILLSGKQLNTIVRQNFEIQIFLQKDITGQQIAEFKKYLENSSFVAKENGLSLVTFTSKEDAGKKFMEETGENFARFLGENPLRDAFTLKIAEKDLSSARMKQIKAEIAQMEGVFEVAYMEVLIGSIQENIQRVSILFLGIASILLVTSVWLIRNTIKLTLYSQRFLIRTMELVGAKPWFIQKPYVISMFWRGFAGGGLAAIFMLMGLQGAQNFLPQIHILLIPEEVALLLLSLLFIGSLIGALSSWLSVRKFQGKKLDQLHVY